MATMLREVPLRALWLGLALTAAGHPAHAQALPEAPADPTAAAPPSSGAAFVPTLGAQLTYSNNATQAAASARRSDTIASVSPGMRLSYRGPSTTLSGQFQLSALRYFNHTQSDRVMPNGLLSLHTDIARQGFGVDASVASDQVAPQFNSAQAATANAGNSYTNTRVRVSPFIDRPLDAQTRLQARLERTQLHATANGDGLANRPDTSTDRANVLLSRRPARIGYELEARFQNSQANGQPQAIYTERIAKGTLLYAITPDLDVGLVMGKESSDVQQQRQRDTVRGGRFEWRASERTLIKTLIEDRFFGRGWQADVSHRMPMLTLGMSSSRQVQTYSQSAGNGSNYGGSTQALLDALLTTRIPNEVERAKAVNDLIAQRNLPSQLGSNRDLYDLNAQLRQSMSLRAAIMGKRSMLLLTAGQSNSHAIAGEAFSSLLGSGSETREHYVDIQVNHRLTPTSTANLGLRVTRARIFTPQLASITSPRDQGLRVNLATRLAPRSQVIWGVKRTRTVAATQGGTVTENTVFAGLEHRF